MADPLGVVLLCALGGAVGGLLVAAAVIYAVNGLLPGLLQRTQVQVDVKLAVPPVRIPAQVQPPDPVVIPVATAPLPSAAELGQRVLAEYPDAGPRALARIVGCAPSTASAIIEAQRQGGGSAAEP